MRSAPFASRGGAPRSGCGRLTRASPRAPSLGQRLPPTQPVSYGREGLPTRCGGPSSTPIYSAPYDAVTEAGLDNVSTPDVGDPGSDVYLKDADDPGSVPLYMALDVAPPDAAFAQAAVWQLNGAVSSFMAKQVLEKAPASPRAAAARLRDRPVTLAFCFNYSVELRGLCVLSV